MKRLITITLLALGTVNIADAVDCSGGCNYGTSGDPDWVYITWCCDTGYHCHIYCNAYPPTGGCTKDESW